MASSPPESIGTRLAPLFRRFDRRNRRGLHQVLDFRGWGARPARKKIQIRRQPLCTVAYKDAIL
jgi:hypothetical protein